jgi:hypothetical protein
MGEFFDQPAKLSPELRERKGNAGITPDNSQILSPSSNHLYKSLKAAHFSGHLTRRVSEVRMEQAISSSGFCCTLSSTDDAAHARIDTLLHLMRNIVYTFV